jgi:hypothetical protein
MTRGWAPIARFRYLITDYWLLITGLRQIAPRRFAGAFSPVSEVIA